MNTRIQVLENQFENLIERLETLENELVFDVFCQKYGCYVCKKFCEYNGNRNTCERYNCSEYLNKKL